MFAPRVAKPKTRPAANSPNKLAPERSIPAGQRLGDGAAERLQRTIGNQAVLALLALPHRGDTVRSENKPPGLGGWARALFHAPETKPADPDELLADRAADAAVRDERAPHTIAAVSAPDVGTPPWGSGRPLTRDERQWHEPRAGANLADVRIHEGVAPERCARLLGARAFTIGRDVVVGSGAYMPGTEAGRHLMAHELSHVVAARGRPPVLARVALTATDFDALADSLNDAITTATADEELIYVALQKLERDATAIASLKAAYKKRHKTDLATALASRLKGHGLGLAQTLLGATGGLAVAKAPPSTTANYEAVARAVHAALFAKTLDVQGVYAALLPLAFDSARTSTLKTTYKTLFNAELEDDLAKKFTSISPSYALYLLNAPAPASAHAPSNFTTQPGFGTPPATAPPAAAGGTVSAGTEVPWKTTAGQTGTFGFGVGYSGALSADSRWLQFIEREIDFTPKGGGKPVALDKEISASQGRNKYRLTTAAAAPNWVVDSYDPSNPFFDETHPSTAWRDATSVSIYDAPGAEPAVVKEQFDNGATAVVSRAHFDIYLIRDFSAIYHVEIEIVWTYSAPKTRTSSHAVKATGPVSGLPSALKAALVQKYPAYAYIR